MAAHHRGAHRAPDDDRPPLPRRVPGATLTGAQSGRPAPYRGAFRPADRVDDHQGVDPVLLARIRAFLVRLDGGT